MDDSPKKPRTARCLLQIENLFNFLVPGVLAARVAKLFGLQALGVFLLVFCRRVVAVLAIAALQRDCFSHALSSYLSLLVRFLSLHP